MATEEFWKSQHNPKCVSPGCERCDPEAIERKRKRIDEAITMDDIHKHALKVDLTRDRYYEKLRAVARIKQGEKRNKMRRRMTKNKMARQSRRKNQR